MRIGSYTLLVARRYLSPSRRNRFVSFITAIAVLGMTFGVTALLISMAILDGFDKTLRTNIVSFLGHIEVNAFGARPLLGYPKMLTEVPRKVPAVRAISPYASREAIIRSRAALEGVLLKGVLADRDVSSLRGSMVAGVFAFAAPVAGTPPDLVLGERLAQRLKVSVGDSVVVFSPNGVPSPENPPAIEQFRICGIYRTGMAQFDDIYIYTSLPAAQQMFDFAPDQVSGYDILVKDVEKVDSVAAQLDTAMGFPHYPQPVFNIQQYQSIFAWLDLQRAPIPVVLGLIIIVAVFNIASTLLMVVLEKTESIGVLSTLGAKPTGIMGIFVGQGVLIGLGGTMLGVLLSVAFTIVQQQFHVLRLDPVIYVIDAVPVSFTPWHYGLVIAGSLFLSVLFTIIPALIASAVRPVKALRFR